MLRISKVEDILNTVLELYQPDDLLLHKKFNIIVFFIL